MSERGLSNETPDIEHTADYLSRSMQDSLNNQGSWNERISGDLAGVLRRLAIVETAIENMVNEKKRTTTEGHKKGPTLRSQK